MASDKHMTSSEEERAPKRAKQDTQEHEQAPEVPALSALDYTLAKRALNKIGHPSEAANNIIGIPHLPDIYTPAIEEGIGPLEAAGQAHYSLPVIMKKSGTRVCLYMDLNTAPTRRGTTRVFYHATLYCLELSVACPGQKWVRMGHIYGYLVRRPSEWEPRPGCGTESWRTHWLTQKISEYYDDEKELMECLRCLFRRSGEPQKQAEDVWGLRDGSTIFFIQKVFIHEDFAGQGLLQHVFKMFYTVLNAASLPDRLRPEGAITFLLEPGYVPGEEGRYWRKVPDEDLKDPKDIAEVERILTYIYTRPSNGYHVCVKDKSVGGFAHTILGKRIIAHPPRGREAYGRHSTVDWEEVPARLLQEEDEEGEEEEEEEESATESQPATDNEEDVVGEDASDPDDDDYRVSSEEEEDEEVEIPSDTNGADEKKEVEELETASTHEYHPARPYRGKMMLHRVPLMASRSPSRSEAALGQVQPNHSQHPASCSSRIENLLN